MTKTEYIINGQEVSYNVTEDGYDVYLGSKPWISQHEPHIPYSELGYEEGCLKQIEQLVTSQTEPEEEAGSDYESRLSALEEENAMLYATIDDILMNVIPSMTGESEVN